MVPNAWHLILLTVGLLGSCKQTDTTSGTRRIISSSPAGNAGVGAGTATPTTTPKATQTATPKVTGTQGGNSTEASVAATALVGTWTTACIPSEESKSSTKNEMEFTATSLAVNVTLYSDTNCKTPSAIMKMDLTYKLGDASARVVGATEFDHTMTKTVTKYMVQELLTGANMSVKSAPDAACRSVVYTLNSETDNTACQVNKTQYNLVKISGSNLYMGDCSGEADCTTEAARSTQLDVTQVYTKTK